MINSLKIIFAAILQSLSLIIPIGQLNSQSTFGFCDGHIHKDTSITYDSKYFHWSADLAIDYYCIKPQDFDFFYIKVL